MRKAAFDSGERKRLYKEAKTFLKVRSMRNKLVKSNAAANGSSGNGVNGNGHAAHGSTVPESKPEETVQV